MWPVVAVALAVDPPGPEGLLGGPPLAGAVGVEVGATLDDGLADVAGDVGD